LIPYGPIFPLRIDESRKDVAARSDPTFFVATGTNVDGTHSAERSGDWTNPTAKYTAGDWAAATVDWTENYDPAGSQVAHLYCFAVDLTTPLALPPMSGRNAFLSVTGFSPSAGLAAADRACQNDATMIGLPNPDRFLALLASPGAAAASRFDTSAGRPTWVRLDGVPWVEHASDLGAGPWLTSLNLSPGGARISGLQVWTGAIDAQTRPDASQDCGGWTVTSGSGTTGFADYTDRRWFQGVTASCGMPRPVYCLEQ
jgi:hypothetical protein